MVTAVTNKILPQIEEWQQTPPFGTIHYGRSIRPIMRRDV